ncbi:MAG: hypothetical protein KDD53_07195, partial [Bdellovibrionales bacterium]|nr:hypothetical protein [Bdellovibrionales bacterium]
LSREWDRPALSEVKIRATIISRLFLDNIPYFQEPALADSPVLGMMGLSFGANEIRIEAAGDSPEKSLKSKALLSSLARVGLDIDEKNTRAPRPPVYH